MLSPVVSLRVNRTPNVMLRGREMKEIGAELRYVKFDFLRVPFIEDVQICEHLFFIVTSIEGKQSIKDIVSLVQNTVGLLIPAAFLVLDKSLDLLPFLLPLALI